MLYAVHSRCTYICIFLTSEKDPFAPQPSAINTNTPKIQRHLQSFNYYRNIEKVIDKNLNNQRYQFIVNHVQEKEPSNSQILYSMYSMDLHMFD